MLYLRLSQIAACSFGWDADGESVGLTEGFEVFDALEGHKLVFRPVRADKCRVIVGIRVRTSDSVCVCLGLL